MSWRGLSLKTRVKLAMATSHHLDRSDITPGSSLNLSVLLENKHTDDK